MSNTTNKTTSKKTEKAKRLIARANSMMQDALLLSMEDDCELSHETKIAIIDACGANNNVLKLANKNEV